MAEDQRELFNRLNQDLQKALKERAKLRLSALRMVKSKILYVNARGDLPDAEIIKIIGKYAKELKESIEEFSKVGRSGEADQVKKELAIVNEYLPAELSPAEVRDLVQDTIKELGASALKEMGNVMKAVLAKQPGIDGKQVSQLVREILK